MERLDTIASLKFFTPEIVLVFALMWVLAWDLILKNRPKERRGVIVGSTLIGLVVALVLSVRLLDAQAYGLFHSMIALDSFGSLLRIIFIVTSIIVLLFTILF